jgi:DNA-binding MarR family transcriptional regulator
MEDLSELSIIDNFKNPILIPIPLSKKRQRERGFNQSELLCRELMSLSPSSFTLRALSVRGLIEKIPDPKDSRKYLYKATFDLLTYLGLSTIAELPMYLETQRDLNSLKEDVYTTQENQEKENITNK